MERLEFQAGTALTAAAAAVAGDLTSFAAAAAANAALVEERMSAVLGLRFAAAASLTADVVGCGNQSWNAAAAAGLLIPMAVAAAAFLCHIAVTTAAAELLVMLPAEKGLTLAPILACLRAVAATAAVAAAVGDGSMLHCPQELASTAVAGGGYH